MPPGGQLYYSTNGTVPACSQGACTGIMYVSPVPIVANTTFLAIAHDPSGCYTDSPPGSAQYKVAPEDAGGD